MKLNYSIFFFISLGILLLSGSCKTDGNMASAGDKGSYSEEKEPVEETAPAPAPGEAEAGKPRIVFLNYAIKKNSDGNPEVRFINKIVTEGRVKKDLSENQEASNGDLKVVELDANQQPVKSIVVPNPLSTTAEYADESGELTKKTLELDSARFSVRIQLDAKTEAIAVEQVSSSGTGTVNLLVTKLN